jgi:SAM-dependent methyltransferase
MIGLWRRFQHDPLGFAKRALYKTVLGPLRYRTADGYDAARYWRDRFTNHGRTLQAVGDEGLSPAENQQMYEDAAKVFGSVCREQAIDCENARVLEIGCGSGFYAQLLHDWGVGDYVGLDITDVFFPELRDRFPAFDFVRRDITADEVEGTFDLVLMIDVVEHIVSDARFASAMEQVRSCLAPGGLFVVSPMVEERPRSMFYQRFWSAQDVVPHFPGYSFGELTPFRHGHMLTVRAPAEAEVLDAA